MQADPVLETKEFLESRFASPRVKSAPLRQLFVNAGHTSFERVHLSRTFRDRRKNSAGFELSSSRLSLTRESPL